MKNFDLTFVTCGFLPNLDNDDLGAFSILQKRGWSCQAAVWNDESVDWAKAGLTVIRSTWDYHLQPEGFLKWARERGSDLLNEIDLVSWNVNKRYLLDLEQKGVAIIPTCLVPFGSDDKTVNALLSSQSSNDVVVKPAIGLSTYGVKRFALDSQLAEAKDHIGQLAAVGDVLIQPFMSAVASHGERALTFIDGVYSHCIRKVPFQKMGAAGHCGEKAVVAPEAEVVFGQKVISLLPKKPLYARVDLVPDDNGALLLMELELVEPSLFLSFDSLASARFANALERRLQQRQAAQAPAFQPTAV